MTVCTADPKVELETLELACRERRLSELAIFRDSLEEKNRQLWEMRKRLEVLEQTLERMVSAGRQVAPALQRSPLYGPIPRRWRS
jgi:hypothetical protein